MVNYPFAIDDWLPRFPLSRHLTQDSGDLPPQIYAHVVTSPAHICDLEQLRVGLRDQFIWGKAIPVDVFVMAEGEPQDRHVTKLGGIPYRPASAPWPLQGDGRRWQFLAQVCFADSKDLTGALPGDVLLVFAEDAEWPDALHFEWQPLGLSELVTVLDMPPLVSPFAPCYGQIYRTCNYPEAKRAPGYELARYLTWNGAEVNSDYCVPQFSATLIGEAPYYANGRPDLPGQPLCTLNSVYPALTERYPWVNQPEPLCQDEEEWLSAPPEPWFRFGDTGCVYVFIDEDGRLHSALDCA